MDEYLERISENEKKIERLEKSIRSSTAKLKKLKDDNARLTYLSISERYKTSGRDLLDLLEREHQQAEMLGTDVMADTENGNNQNTSDDDSENAEDSDEDELTGQMSFYN